MNSGPQQHGTNKRTPVVVRSAGDAPSRSGVADDAGDGVESAGAVARAGGIPVVLVGRTNLEGVLRLDSMFEVHRASDGPAALGQIAQIQIGLPAGVRPLVVLSPECDAASRDAAFSEAVTMVSPGARVVRLGDAVEGAAGAGANGAGNGACVLLMGGAPGALREALRRFAAPSSVPCEASAAAERVVESVMAPSGARTPASKPIDTPMLRAMLAGRDILLPAMEAIRAGLGTKDVFFEEPSIAASTPADESRRRVAVEHHAKVFGHLVSASASADAMTSWAEWLANWLALREQQEQLRTAALVDDLTGAWNRRYFDGFLNAALKHAVEHDHSVTVMYFDIDNFKQYNDRFGHAAGDEILRETVRLLQSVIRPTDRVCRIGGDEFGVVFHEPEGPRDPASAPPSSIWEIAKRFQRQICEHRFPKLGELAPGTLTISGGLASFPHDAKTAEELVARADELAIQSKRQGKNAITFGPGAERVCGMK